MCVILCTEEYSALSDKHPGGRPSKYNPELHPLLAEYLARAGLKDSEISDKLGIDEATLNRWKNKYKEFCKSLKAGKEQIDDGVERALLSNAMGFEREVEVSTKQGIVTMTQFFKPETTAQIFWLKNRRPKEWRDRQEITGAEGKPIEILYVNTFTGV